MYHDPSPDGSPDSFIIASHCGKAMPAASSERRLPRHIQNRTETKIRKDWIICAMAKVELGVPMLLVINPLIGIHVHTTYKDFL